MVVVDFKNEWTMKLVFFVVGACALRWGPQRRQQVKIEEPKTVLDAFVDVLGGETVVDRFKAYCTLTATRLFMCVRRQILLDDNSKDADLRAASKRAASEVESGLAILDELRAPLAAEFEARMLSGDLKKAPGLEDAFLDAVKVELRRLSLVEKQTLKEIGDGSTFVEQFDDMIDDLRMWWRAQFPPHVISLD